MLDFEIPQNFTLIPFLGYQNYMLDFEIPQDFTLIPNGQAAEKVYIQKKLEPQRVLTEVAPTGIELVFVKKTRCERYVSQPLAFTVLAFVAPTGIEPVFHA